MPSALAIPGRPLQGRPLHGLYFAWRGQLYRVGPEELASCLWTDGRCEPYDIAWANQIIGALTAKITGKGPET